MNNAAPIPGRKRGKKPVHLVAASGYHTPQDCVWEAIRSLKQFNQIDIEMWLDKRQHKVINSSTLKSYLNRLKKGHYITVIDVTQLKGIAKVHRYKLVNDTGIHAPRLTKEGKPTTLGMGRENLWRAMKILDTFNYKDLTQAATTEVIAVKPSEAKDYIKHLYKAGYLQLISASSQKTATPARYRLLINKNTGPRPPMIQRIKQVFDPNLNQVMWSQDGGIH